MLRSRSLRMIMVGIAFAAIFAVPLFVFAACGEAGGSDPYCLREFAGFTGIKPAQDATLPALIGSFIRIVLVLVGVIFFGLLVFAGIRWMTSRGNVEIVEEARRIIENTAIGLVIIIISYALATFVVTNLFT